jgi:activator of 2-hydroxyglutaryl-CoA dehydratase
MNIVVPEDPDYMGALGAAEAALAGVIKEEIKAKVLEKETV